MYYFTNSRFKESKTYANKKCRLLNGLDRLRDYFCIKSTRLGCMQSQRF